MTPTLPELSKIVFSKNGWKRYSVDHHHCGMPSTGVQGNSWYLMLMLFHLCAVLLPFGQEARLWTCKCVMVLMELTLLHQGAAAFKAVGVQLPMLQHLHVYAEVRQL